MNKRIDELVTATDAWCDQNLPVNWTDDVDKYLPIWNEKFAQLIVKECADLCSKYGDRVEYNRPNSGYEAWECADIIKQHFGVE